MLSLPRAAIAASLLGCSAAAVMIACGDNGPSGPEPPDPALVEQGREIFRFDTYGDETFWTDTLRMHEVIQAAVDPTTALEVGLKVDADALPAEIVQGIQSGAVSLTDPATTVALLKLNAVVGLKGTVETTTEGRDTLVRVGTTCALCHSTVNNSFAPGIGSRLDGWQNSDLNPGAIIALSPALSAELKAVYSSWGPGRYDPRFNLDGINGPVVIPPAYGLLGLNRIIYTGDGADIAYWNLYVGVTQMHGHGTFADPRIGVSVQNPPDMISSKLEALQAYQLSLEAPRPPAGSFDPAAAQRGRGVFEGAGTCASCHTGNLLTDANGRLHDPSAVVSEPEPNGAPSYASRSATKQYRTTPLRGLLLHPPYFHNGSAATLEAVVELYNTKKGLNLTAEQKADLVEYLKSI